MHRGQPYSHRRLACEQALDDFGGEGRKRRQAAEETGDGEELPGEWKVGVEMEQPNRDADQKTADDVRRQRAERHCDEQRIQEHPQQPAHPRPECSASADRQKIERGEVVQGRHPLNSNGFAVPPVKIARLRNEVFL